MLPNGNKRFMLAENTRKCTLSDGTRRCLLSDGTWRCMLSTNIRDIFLYTRYILSWCWYLMSTCTKPCLISICNMNVFCLLVMGLCKLMTGTRGASVY